MDGTGLDVVSFCMLLFRQPATLQPLTGCKEVLKILSLHIFNHTNVNFYHNVTWI